MKKTHYCDFRDFERAWEYAARRKMFGHNVQISKRKENVRVFFSAIRINVDRAVEVPKGENKK